MAFVQEIEIWALYQMFMYKQKSVLDNVTLKILWDFEIQMDQMSRPRIN